MTPDCELLRRYAEQGDEAAFAEVVGRHVDLVYSAALRLVGGDAHLAQDVAQGVFTALARRAARLARHASIVGWLYTTARYTAGSLRRSRHRRIVREQEAYAMNQPAHSSEINWDALQPVLDEAVCALAAADREAVLLRFFQNKSHREVGDALGLGEEAARKRVDRALEKLRAHFARRGVAVSAGVLAAEIGANSVQAAPVGLAESLTGTSLAGAGATAEGVFLKIFLMSTKTKLLAASVIVLLFALLGGGVWWFNRPITITQQKTVSAPAPVNAVAPTIATPIAQVEPPKLPPAVPSSGTSHDTATPVTDNSPPGQRKEIASAIKDMIARLEAGDTEGVLHEYSGIYDTSGRNPTPPRTQAALKRSFDKHRLQMLAVLESLQTVTPQYTLSPGGADFYFYDMTDPITLKSGKFTIYKSNLPNNKPKSGWAIDVNLLEQWDEESGDSQQTTFIQNSP